MGNLVPFTRENTKVGNRVLAGVNGTCHPGTILVVRPHIVAKQIRVEIQFDDIYGPGSGGLMKTRIGHIPGMAVWVEDPGDSPCSLSPRH